MKKFYKLIIPDKNQVIDPYYTYDDDSNNHVELSVETLKQGVRLVKPDDKKWNELTTFSDALYALGPDDEYVSFYFRNRIYLESLNIDDNLDAQIKLQIITRAINFKSDYYWKPEFVMNEERFFPHFKFCFEQELDNDYIDKDFVKNQHRRAFDDKIIYFSQAVKYIEDLPIITPGLTFHSKETAEYAGKTFIDYYIQYLFRTEMIKKSYIQTGNMQKD